MMKGLFTRAAHPAAEKLLKELRCDFERQPDGTLYVPGSIALSGKGLTALPDLSCVSVGRDFWCGENKLTSLKGAPKEVRGNFYCQDNLLESLIHAPLVEGHFYCDRNRLTTLKGAPKSLLGFNCINNRLTSLGHAPHFVEFGFYCGSNPLGNLHGAPFRFSTLSSDFGEFSSRAALDEYMSKINEEARLTRELATERAAEEAATRVAAGTQEEIVVRKPLQLRKRGAAP